MFRKNQSKYKNKKTIIDGITFDSIKEAKYYQQLQLMKAARMPFDRVIHFELQPAFKYIVKYEANGKIHQAKQQYKADFKVFYADGHIEIVDIKGVRTATYKRKKKIVEKLFNIKIIEK